MTSENGTTNTPDVRPDSQVAADFAAEMFRAGRIELGAAVARIALQADRIERERAAQTPALDGPAPIYAAAAQEAVFGTQQGPELAAGATPPTAKCVFQWQRPTGTAGSYTVDTCEKPVYWSEGQLGDASHVAVPAAWFHVDPAIDNHHAPVVEQ